MPKEKLIVKRNKFGWGVYAGRVYKKGEIICVMKGKKKVPDNLYYHGNNFRKAQINPLQIGRIHYLDLDKPYIYFNHSCEPNAGIRNTATLFALKKIKKGEEITFDYSTTVDEAFLCKCGSKKCRGVVADFFAIPQKLQQFYVRRGAVPKFIEKKYKKYHNK